MAQVVRKNEISCEGIGKGWVELENLQKPVPLNGVQIRISEGPHVSRALADRGVLPKTISEDVTFAQNGHDLFVLDDLETSGDDEAQWVYRFARVVQQIPGRAVRHREVHREGAQATVRR